MAAGAHQKSKEYAVDDGSFLVARKIFLDILIWNGVIDDSA